MNVCSLTWFKYYCFIFFIFKLKSFILYFKFSNNQRLIDSLVTPRTHSTYIRKIYSDIYYVWVNL